MEVRAIVLAAGKGTRMKSELPKCAHCIIDKSMVEYVVDSLKMAKIDDVTTVVGYKREVIEAILARKTKFAYQDEQLGTAHAVLMAEKHLKNKDGLTLIAIGDMPLITHETYASIIAHHIKEEADLTVLTTSHPNPYGYGRIIRDDRGNISEIVEERDCTESQKLIQEINSSVYLVDNKKLFESLHEIKNNNKQNEYYLTDIVRIFNNKDLKVCGYKALNYMEISGANDKLQLMEMETALQNQIIKQHLLNGVTVHNAQTVTIGVDAKIASGSTIMPGSIIVGNSIIEKNAIIGPNTEINSSQVCEGAIVKYSRIKNSKIGVGQKIGPYVNILNNEIIKEY